MVVNLSWEEVITICDLNFLTSYEIRVIVLDEFETKSDIKGYHPYMNIWKPVLGENLPTHPEPENIMNKYVAAALEDKQVVGHLT